MELAKGNRALSFPLKVFGLRSQKTEIASESSNLFAIRLNIADITAEQMNRMHELMLITYDKINLQQFKADLLSKDGAFILKDTHTNKIQGFSTYKELQFNISGRKVVGLFSGDTVINKKYWRHRTLGKAFLKYLFIQKLKNPFRPYYWYLISKGFKTYLLMANNFSFHYPRVETETPKEVKVIIDKVYNYLYGEDYNQKLGLIAPKKGRYYLRENHDEISEDLIASNQRVRFFVSQNPNWHEGVELACIAKMTLLMPIYYQIKSFWKVVYAKK